MSIITTINTTANSIKILKTLQPRFIATHGAGSLIELLLTLRTRLNRLLECISYMCTSLNPLSLSRRIQLASELTTSLREYIFLMTFFHEHQKQHFLLYSNPMNSLTLKGIQKAVYHRKGLISYAARLSQCSIALDHFLSSFDWYIVAGKIGGPSPVHALCTYSWHSHVYSLISPSHTHEQDFLSSC